MTNEWDKFPPNFQLDDLAKSVLHEIADHFLSTGSGLPDRPKRNELGKNRRTLDLLVSKSLVTDITNKYYPAFASLYYLSPETRNRFEAATTLVLKAFQELFKADAGGTFSLVQIGDQINRMAPGNVGTDTARIGMLFVRDFQNYFGNVHDYSRDAPIVSATVWENILDFEDLQQSWMEEVLRRDPNFARVTMPVGENVETAKTAVDPNQQKIVFVIHGRDERLRAGTFDFLRALGLEPLEWIKAMRLTGKSSPYIGEVLDAAFRNAQAVVVLLTPDDEAQLRADLVNPSDSAHETSLMGQARPNVLFEAGMAFASHSDKTVLVQIGEIRPFSDIAGRHVVRMDDSVQRRHELAVKLRIAGCSVDLDGSDWQKAGDFTPPRGSGLSSSSSDGGSLTSEKARAREPRLSEHNRVIVAPISRVTSDSEYILESADEIGIVIRLANGVQVRIPKADYLESWDDFLGKPKIILIRKYFQGYFPGHEGAEEYFLPR